MSTTNHTLAVLALPALLAGAALLTTLAGAQPPTADVNAPTQAHTHEGLGVGGKQPHNIDLAELETRSLERFAELDSNNNGLINAEEFAAAAKLGDGHKGRHHRGGRHGDRHGKGHRAQDYEEQGQADKEAAKAERKAELFARLDTDSNGELSTEEFADRRDVSKALRKEAHLQARFSHLDEDSDQQISLEEFQRRLEKMRALDSDADGTVSRAELRSGMKAHKAANAR